MWTAGLSSQYKQNNLKISTVGFADGSVVKNLPASAVDTGWIPGPKRAHTSQGNEACAPRLLNLCLRAWELQLLSSRAITTEARVPWRPSSATREATAMRSLLSATREKPAWQLSPSILPSPQKKQKKTKHRTPHEDCKRVSQPGYHWRLGPDASLSGRLSCAL